MGQNIDHKTEKTLYPKTIQAEPCVPRIYSNNLLQKSRKDVLNFDTEFTKEEPTLTPINLEVVKTINQDEFKGFSFYNTQFGKQVS